MEGVSRPTSVIGVLVGAAVLAALLVVIFSVTVLSNGEARGAERDAALDRVEARRSFGANQGEAPSRAAIEALLDDFHAAASAAAFDRYFAHLSPRALFVGTDATEVWSVDEFKAFAKPHFDAGNGWTYHPENRRVDLTSSGRSAAFFEDLTSPKYGRLRGSGTVVHDGERWRILHYVLSFAVPNELAPDLVEGVATLPDKDGE